MNVLVFDIETVPDLEGGSRIYDLHGLSDKDTASALFNLRRQENGSEFLRLHLHRVVAISVVLRSAQGVKVWSLGDEDSTEKELIERFYDGIDRFTPQIVSWNGGGFDLPVLNYRALKHGVVAHRITPLHAGVRRSHRRTVPSADAVRNSSVTASMLTLTTCAVCPMKYLMYSLLYRE